MIINAQQDKLINSPVRSINGKVELYKDSTLINTFTNKDRLISINVERTGKEKFFGYGLCQRLNVHLIDSKRELDLKTENSMKVLFNGVTSLPLFNISEVHRDENTNELSITAYDNIDKLNAHTVSEIELKTYNIEQFAKACAKLINANLLIKNVADNSFKTEYIDGANFDGKETIREVLDDIAEVTQTIYYLDKDNNLVFKRLNKDGQPDLIIDKNKYITLSSKTNKRLSKIISATDLGDDVYAEIKEIGSTQFVRNNPFWELRDDIDTLLNNAILSVGGFTINQFECEWRGNYLLEIGDKLGLITKDNATVYSYVLNDTIEYNGAYLQKTEWNYTEDDSESSDNSSSLGEALRDTFARVDKANKQIDLVVKDTNENKQAISQLQLDTNGINATVESIQKNNNDSFDNINNNIESLNKKVEASMTSDEVKLEIKKELDNGISKVETNTGFTFDDNGLTVNKTNSEMKTTITEDGMKVFKNDEITLEANNAGVEAKNLHATTYLIIGTNSRFEDYKDNRTGCFWIGGK